MTASLTAESLDLHGVNKVVFDRLVEQIASDHGYIEPSEAGWVCGHILRLSHVGGEAKHSRIAEIRTALRPYMSPYGTDPLPKQATVCGICQMRADEAKAAGRKPSRVYAYRISPELHPLVLAGREGRAAA